MPRWERILRTTAAGLVRWERGIGCSDRQRDLPGSLEPPDCLASPSIRDACVDEARLDVAMTKVILYEVDRLACVEIAETRGLFYEEKTMPPAEGVCGSGPP
jgi:hypothetical protein